MTVVGVEMFVLWNSSTLCSHHNLFSLYIWYFQQSWTFPIFNCVILNYSKEHFLWLIYDLWFYFCFGLSLLKLIVSPVKDIIRFIFGEYNCSMLFIYIRRYLWRLFEGMTSHRKTLEILIDRFHNLYCFQLFINCCWPVTDIMEVALSMFFFVRITKLRSFWLRVLKRPTLLLFFW